ncbi:uroporphyrin-III methyltransferase [Desulfocarbo indianensis]|nr:uroporphyrin-III methyltransferase [Desulfocarbo indianensis]
MRKYRLTKHFYLALMILLAAAAMVAAPGGAQDVQAAQGKLYLVGLGVGDLDNMTIRAHRVLTQADIIFGMKHDFKQYAELFKGKELHEAGHLLFMEKSLQKRGRDKMPPKRMPPDKHQAMQEETRRIIREAVAAGKTVAVVSGGDPMLYGPHTGYLQEFADLKPEVVPGLSCFNAANAALQRGPNKGFVSHSVILTAAMTTSKGYKGKDTLAKLGETQSTMVFFTMRMNLPEVVAQLKESYPGDTPIAIVSYAGYQDREKVLVASLDTILEKTKGEKLPFEHLIYVGDFLK